MTEEEFDKIYLDTHLQLKTTDVLNKGSFNKSNLMTYQPGDKSIHTMGKIPGKSLIESKEMEKRREGVEHLVFDAIAVNAHKAKDMKLETLIGFAIKMSPQKVEGDVNHTFTLAEMIKQAHDERNTVDVEEKGEQRE